MLFLTLLIFFIVWDFLVNKLSNSFLIFFCQCWLSRQHMSVKAEIVFHEHSSLLFNISDRRSWWHDISNSAEILSWYLTEAWKLAAMTGFWFGTCTHRWFNTGCITDLVTEFLFEFDVKCLLVFTNWLRIREYFGCWTCETASLFHFESQLCLSIRAVRILAWR